MKHAGATIAEIAYLHSDAAFLFPIVPEAPFGAELLALADAQRPNAHGRPCRVHRMQTYPDALDVAKNAGASSVVSVLTLAQGLPKMAENLRAAAQRSQAMVVHVAGAEVDAETFELRPAAGAAYDLASTGAAVVVASSPLGCADSAMYCYALAHSLRRPVVHLVDGMLGLAARSSAALSWDALSSRAQMVHRQQPAAGAGHPLELGDFHAFGYHGDRSARAVFVAVGGAIHSAHRAVESHAGHGLGLVAVQLVEPWHEERFLDLLPHSTQLVIVLDYASQARPLHQRVQSAVGRSAQLRAVATLNVECSTSEDTDVDRLLQLAASHGRGFGAGPGGAPLSIAQVPAASSGAGPAVPGARQFKLWWSPSAEAAQSEQLFAALAAGTGHVDCAGYHDVYHKAGHERAVTDVLVTSTPGLHLNHAICRADMAVVYRTELLDDVDVFASLRDGGIALLNCPTNHIAKHRIVPADAAQRQLRIYQVNANEAGRICRTDADLVMCICAAFLAGQDSGLSADAALRAVHTHYGSVPIEMMEYVVYAALVLFPVERVLDGKLPSEQHSAPDGPFQLVSEPGAKPAGFAPRALYTGGGAEPQKPLEMLHEEDVVNRCIASNKASVEYTHRPDLPDTIEFVVKKNVRLTSPTYYRDVFHIELAPRDPGHKLDYLPGMVLNIYPKNNPVLVDSLLADLELDGKQYVARRYKTRSGEMMEEINTVAHYMNHVLDVFGCPKPSFYRALVDFTDSPMTASLLTAYADNYEAAVDEALTYADVLTRFKGSVSVPPEELVKGSLIPSVAARSYSIASCTDIVGNQIDLVVVVETWQNKLGDTKSGLCSSYLSRLRSPHPAEGLMVTGNVVSSTALKISDYTKPCVMIGLGTGIAPFRAFIQKYFYEREKHGVNAGEIVVYFGARTSSDEYLYGHELEQYKLWGVVADLRLAFSRDPGQKKTYVQDLIKQDGDVLKRLVLQKQGYIMMCGPDWPVPTIHKSLSEMGIDVNEMMREGRYLEEVY